MSRLNDANAFAHLVQPNAVAIEAIAVLADDHVELELVVVQVRLIAA